MIYLQHATPCNLVFCCRKTKAVVAKGVAYRLEDSIVYGVPLEDGFIKVLVELVMNECEGFELRVPLPNDGIETLGQALGKFIQWEQEFVVLQQVYICFNLKVKLEYDFFIHAHMMFIGLIIYFLIGPDHQYKSHCS